MKAVALGAICEFKYGKSLAAKDRDGQGSPVYGSNGVVGSHIAVVTVGPTIVVGRKGSYGEVNFSRVPCWPIDTTYYIDPSCTDQDLKWLSHLLPTLGLNRMNRAAAVPGLNREDAYRVKVLLPPLDEQRRIAAILDKADDLRTKRREAVARLDALTQSIFHDMFVNASMRMEALHNIVKLKSGNFLPAKNMAALGIFAVYGGNGINGRHDQFMFEEPKVVVGRVGAYCGVVHVTEPRSWITDNALFAAFISADIIEQYLAMALKFADLHQYASQSGQPLISGNRINLVEIAIPSLALQHEFATRVAAVERLKNHHRSQLAELDALFASLQHRAFNGTL